MGADRPSGARGRCNDGSPLRRPVSRLRFFPMPSSVDRPTLAVASGWTDYRLIDCGYGMKQERWGPYVLVRPDPQVIWPRRGRAAEQPWEGWDGFYHRSEKGGGSWEFRRELPEHWEIGYAP